MRFCMVTTFYPPFHMGGDAIYVRALALALRREGHSIDVVHCEDAFGVAGGRPVTTPPADDDGIVVHRLRHPLGILSPLITQQTGHPGLKRSALKAVLDQGYDVIHFHNISLVGGPGVLELGRSRIKLLTLHEHWLLCPTHIFWKNKERACDRPTCWTCSIRSGIPPQLWRLGNLITRQLEHVDLLLAPSEFTAARHKAAGITRPIEVFPLFSRIEPWGTKPKAPQRPLFLFAGRVTASKGVGQLVKMFRALPDYDLWIAGDGDLRHKLEAECTEAANIRFLGLVDAPRLSMLYGEATATVIPSLAPESMALVALESFANSTPVVTRNAGGCGELVRASNAGFVCEDEGELLAAIHALARDPDLVLAMGRQARAIYEQKYTQRVHIAAYLQRVDSLLASTQSISYSPSCAPC
jgi:glycosyltransferase involved in cell wall biosynthesis